VRRSSVGVLIVDLGGCMEMGDVVSGSGYGIVWGLVECVLV
jgi:hypothetical protein